MRKPRLTDRVLRGIIAMGMPEVVNVLDGCTELEEFSGVITAQEVADANRALVWAHAMVRWKEYRRLVARAVEAAEAERLSTTNHSTDVRAP